MTWVDRVRSSLRGESAYHVAAPATIRIKLDANESPFALSAAARASVAAALAGVELNRYPDARASALKALMQSKLGLHPTEVSLGNGSDESLGLLCSAFGEPRDGRPGRVLYPWPSFVVYRTAALAAGLSPVEVPLGSRFEADAQALLDAVERERPNLIFLATPNNPTGTVWPREVIVALCEKYPDVITVVDEAYLPYSDQPSCIELTRKYPHCVVVQTLSKVGLAALRIGFVIAQPEVIATIEKVRPPYNLDSLSQAAVTVILRDHADELEAHLAVVRSERERLATGLAGLGLEVFPSQANLLLVRSPKATALWSHLGAQGISVRNFDGPLAGPLAGCLRITVGTATENDALLAALSSAPT